MSAACALLFGAAAAVHYHVLGLTLSHYDARAHLVVARRIFDSLIPGWQQVGGVWLPLPHVLDALPVQIDWLYRTGYSGVAIAVLSMALAAWSIAAVIHRATGSAAGGFVAAALLMLNPNVLYLQSTPMTEPLLFATTFLAVALVAQWCEAGVARSEPRESRIQDPPASRLSPLASAASGGALIAAALSRFEAWPVVAALVVLAFVVLVRGGVGVPDAFRRVRGLALWPMWAIAGFMLNSKVTVGSFFVSSGFFIPDNPAQGHVWLAWTQVWDGLVRLSGPVVPWLAVAATIGLLARFARRPEPAVTILALAACAVLPWAAYYQGHPVRIRYDVPSVAACAALIGTGVALLPRAAGAIAGIAIVALAAWQTPPFDRSAPVVVEAQRVASEDAARQTVSDYLSTHRDGQPIMMSMGSLAQYMHDLSACGFNVRDFLHEGNGELWKYALRTPRPYVEWIVIQEKADRDEIFRQTQVDPGFLAGYARVSSGGGIALYRRR